MTRSLCSKHKFFLSIEKPSSLYNDELAAFMGITIVWFKNKYQTKTWESGHIVYQSFGIPSSEKK